MTQPIDIQSLRTKLEGSRGREYWRSLEAVSETPEFKEFVQREFPQHASEWLDPVGRRGFLKLMGASLALAGASACTRQPEELIVPYVRQPENVVPGRPLFFATAMPLLGEIRPWGTFVQVIGQAFSGRQAVQGAGLRFLTESITSPTLVSQL